MATYFRIRNKHYYLRLRVPADLLSKIPQPELLKSLHTKDRKLAQLAASALLRRITEAFALVRSGYISDEQLLTKLSDLLERNGTKHSSPPRPEPAIPAPLTSSSPSLKLVIEQYVNDHRSQWTDKTRLEYASYFRLLQDVLQVQTVSEIDRDSVRRVRDTLNRLPANLYKKYPCCSIDQIVLKEGITPMSVTTVNKLLTLLGSLMLHCIKEGFRTDNPTEGLKIKKTRRPDEERKAYSTDDLKALVSSLPAPDERPERWWIPIIGLYSGLRMGEICSLHVADIRQVDGIWCFDVNQDGDKRLKNLSSKRLVPIHPYLVRKGLLDLVERLKKDKEPRVWPSLERRDIDGYCHSFGNWFGRFNRKCVTLDPLKTFHSLRHTFADRLKQQGEQEALIAELMGHSNGSITTGRYGKRYRPHILYETICKLSYSE